MNFQNATFEASYGLFSQIPEGELPELAFAGKSNVGKSSLINKLFNRKKLARVSAVPGKTATINFYDIDGKAKLVDLPGYGYAKVAKTEKERWSGLIEGYLASERDIALVFLLIDMRHAPGKNDLHMIDYLIETEFPFVIILTKSDKLSKTQYKAQLELMEKEIPYAEQVTMVPFSAVTGEGVEAIQNIIRSVCEPEEIGE